jgi:hypothetical protein
VGVVTVYYRAMTTEGPGKGAAPPPPPPVHVHGSHVPAHEVRFLVIATFYR